MTVTEVKASVGKRVTRKIYRGSEYTVDFLPKIKLELVLTDKQVDAAVATHRQGRQDRQDRRR